MEHHHLKLIEISAEKTSLHVLGQFIAHEAVHPIGSWRDLYHRLRGDRKIFALFNPQHMLEPLIFIEVALLGHLPHHMDDILQPDAPVMEPQRASHAVFYSITNMKPGLGQSQLGHELIMRTVEHLQKVLPNIQHFATLSPIPGFAVWYGAQKPAPASLEEIKANKEALLTSCTKYLLSVDDSGRVLDPVANFHLQNGAEIGTLCWISDISQKRLDQSFGIMVNYKYNLDELKINKENYQNHGKIVASEAFTHYYK